MDPKTKTPHPTIRIDNAITDLKYRVDPDMPVDKQVTEIMRNMPGILPIKKMEVTGVISSMLPNNFFFVSYTPVPHSYLGNAPPVIREYATIKGENYTDTGCTSFYLFLHLTFR